MKTKTLAVATALLLCALVHAEEEPEQEEQQQGGRALVLLTQKVTEEYVAEGHEMTMRYSAVNVGNL